MNNLRLWVCVSVIFFATPSVALSQIYNPNPWIKNATIATDGALYAAVEASNTFWKDRINNPDLFNQPITLYVYSEFDERVLARGEPGAIYFSRNYVRQFRKNVKLYGMRVHILAFLWSVAVHERGHTLGLSHAPNGIMSADAGPVPIQAYQWARAIIRRK